MRAGRLRNPITLEWWAKGARTASGATPEGWQPESQRTWAEVEQLRGQTLFAAQAANSKTTARIRLRYRADVAQANGTTLRIRYGDTIYRLEGRPIDLQGRGRELELMCHEWV